MSEPTSAETGPRAKPSVERVSAIPPRVTSKPATSVRAVATVTHLPEIKALSMQLRQWAWALDEARVRRSYRNWVDWIAARQKDESLCLALCPGERWHRFARELDIGDVMHEVPAFELFSGEGGARPHHRWPRLRCAALPSQVSVLAIRDIATFADDWEAIAAMRRDCVLAAVYFDVASLVPDGMFGSLPVGPVIVSETTFANTHPAAPVRVPTHGGFDALIPANMSFSALLDVLVPERIRSAMLTAMVAHDLSGLGRALQAEEDGGTVNARSLAVGDGDRQRRSEAARLVRELEEVTAARDDFVAEVKLVLASLRNERSGIDLGDLVAQNTAAPFDYLVFQFDPASQVEIESLIATRKKRTWWQDTWLVKTSWFFNKKMEARVKESVLDEALSDTKNATVRRLGRIAQSHIEAFNELIESVSQTYFSKGSILPAQGLQPVTARDFTAPHDAVRGNRPKLAADMMAAANSEFSSFAANEARLFRIEREQRGFVGQIADARSAVFGIYFLLLMSLRFIPPFKCSKHEETATLVEAGKQMTRTIQVADVGWQNKVACALNDGLNYYLRLTLGLLILAGFVINFLSRARQERAVLADKFETKLEELTSRLTAFIDRFFKDQLTQMESLIADRANLIEATLDRRRANILARLDLLRANQPSRATERSGPSRTTTLADTARKLHEKVKGDFRQEFAAVLDQS